MLIIDNPIALFLVVLTVFIGLLILFKKKKVPPVPIQLRKPMPVYQKEKAITVANIEPPAVTLINEEPEGDKIENLEEQYLHCDSNLDLSMYMYPGLDLLEPTESGLNITAEELDLKKHAIIDLLNSFEIEVDKLRVTIGPAFTFYELIPAPGVRISQIKSLEADIALSLGIAGVHVVGHIPGTNAVGIEVPNLRPEIVSMRSVLATERFQASVMDLPVALGKSMTNEVVMLDLATLPHLLIAGTTGQGKSVALNALIISLLYKKHPSQLKFVLIDISRAEFSIYNKIERHFLAKLPNESEAVVTESSKVLKTLDALSAEMDMRYNLLKVGQLRNLKDYNEKFSARMLDQNNGHRYLPFIVVVIDEFADLISGKDKAVELLVARIAQQGRVVGIHLVISTQRPSVNILTGTIKANFTSRIAFKVASISDSKTILENGGAERLNGNGDMLFSNGLEVMRLQGTFVSTAEMARVSEFIGNQRGYPTAMLLPRSVEVDFGCKADFDTGRMDSMFEDAARLIVLHQQGSTSLIQRKLKLGYNRAGKVIDQLEAAGIVGPFEGVKAREVLIKDDYSLEQYLLAIKKR